MNGQNGASSCETVTRQWRSVANAAGSPSQKRRRERRTYQLERSSTNRWISRPENGRVEVVEPLAHDRDGLLQARQRPAVEIGQLDRTPSGAGATSLVFAYST